MESIPPRARKEYGILARELNSPELILLKRLGLRGAPDKTLSRVLLALKADSPESGDGALTIVERELLEYYIKYPEERDNVLRWLPPRTQPYLIRAALHERYLLCNDGRMRSHAYYTGPRIKARTAA